MHTVHETRDYLEAVAEAARAYFRARRDGIPQPAIVAARENLRVILGEDPPEPPLVKPWE